MSERGTPNILVEYISPIAGHLVGCINGFIHLLSLNFGRLDVLEL